jgi:methionyl aminopeptidase
MIVQKSDKELALMREAGKISGEALKLAGSLVAPGISTKEIDDAVYKFITSKGATPSFLGYSGFPASCCISINDEVIHGIPSKDTIIKEGDIVSVDLGAYYKGFHSDTAATFAAGNVSEETQKLLDITKECLMKAIKQAVIGNRLGDIGYAVASHAEKNGFAVVTDYVGHGIGTHLHESPDVPNYGTPQRGLRLLEGMTIAIEPMINEKGAQVKTLKDGWTVVTKSGSNSAHFEHTVAITKDGPIILTEA